MPAIHPLEALGYARVRSGLFFGPRPPTGIALASRGVAYLHLTAAQWQPPDHDFPLVDVRRALLRDDLAHTPASMFEEADRMADQAASDVRARGDRNVLVTCSHGLNRSALVTVLAWQKLDGVSAQEAIAECRRLRPGALNQMDFVAYLMG
jgi:hypothetical protein